MRSKPLAFSLPKTNLWVDVGLFSAILLALAPVLTGLANAQAFGNVFARQVRALGNAGDVLLAVSVDGNCANLQQAIHAAHEREMVVIGLSGHGGGAMAQALRDTDNHVDVPHERTARILEILMLVLHCLCDAVDAQLLGECTFGWQRVSRREPVVGDVPAQRGLHRAVQ